MSRCSYNVPPLVLFILPFFFEDILRAEYPRVQTAQVERIGLTRLHARVTEREPAALWCGDVVPLIAYEDSVARQEQADEVWGTCYLLDATGYLYARAPLYTGNLFPRYYGSLEGPRPIGQNLLPEDRFTRWQALFPLLRAYELEAVALLFVDERDFELYLENGLRVLAARDADHAQLVRRIKAALDADAIDLSQRVEYVDLRFGTKAFVRYTAPAQEHSTAAE